MDYTFDLSFNYVSIYIYDFCQDSYKLGLASFKLSKMCSNYENISLMFFITQHGYRNKIFYNIFYYSISSVAIEKRHTNNV